jgi:hypothetical protein
MLTRSKSRRAATTMQRVWRGAMVRRESCSHVHVCPITLHAVEAGRGVVVGRQVYDADALREWIVSSGDFRDPSSRSPLPPHVLHRLRCLTGMDVARLQRRLETQRRAYWENRAVDSYFENQLQTSFGDIVTLLLDERGNEKLITLKCVTELRRVRVLYDAYRRINAGLAAAVLRECVAQLRSVYSFHPIAHDCAMQIIERHIDT